MPVAREGLVARDLRSPLAGPFSLELPPAQCTVVSGPSGSGKSLLLRMLADLDPHEGEAWLDGSARSLMPAHRWRRLVSYVPAESGWWSERVAEHMSDLALARRLAPETGLAPELLDAAVARLSTGERQRLSLIRTLVQQPKVLLLDEPCAALDPVATLQVEALLLRVMQAGTAMVVVSHSEAQAERLADRRLSMAQFALQEPVA